MNAKTMRVIYNKDTGKIHAILSDKQNLEVVMSNFENVDWCSVDTVPFTRKNFPTQVDLETKQLIF